MGALRNGRSERSRVTLETPPDATGAKQSMKDECDINTIMARYVKTGTIEHFNRHSGSYGHVDAFSYHEALTIVKKAEDMFAELPAQVRKRFANDPEGFLAFVQDEKNLPEMRKLGLAMPEKASQVAPASGEQVPPPGGAAAKSSTSKEGGKDKGGD